MGEIGKNVGRDHESAARSQRIRIARVEGAGRLEFLELVARHAERHAAQIDRPVAAQRFVAGS